MLYPDCVDSHASLCYVQLPLFEKKLMQILKFENLLQNRNIFTDVLFPCMRQWCSETTATVHVRRMVFFCLPCMSKQAAWCLFCMACGFEHGCVLSVKEANTTQSLLAAAAALCTAQLEADTSRTAHLRELRLSSAIFTAIS